MVWFLQEHSLALPLTSECIPSSLELRLGWGYWDQRDGNHSFHSSFSPSSPSSPSSFSAIKLVVMTLCNTLISIISPEQIIVTTYPLIGTLFIFHLLVLLGCGNAFWASCHRSLHCCHLQLGSVQMRVNGTLLFGPCLLLLWLSIRFTLCNTSTGGWWLLLLLQSHGLAILCRHVNGCTRFAEWSSSGYPHWPPGCSLHINLNLRAKTPSTSSGSVDLLFSSPLWNQ